MPRFRVVERRFGPDFIHAGKVIRAETRRLNGAKNEMAAAIESTRSHAKSHAGSGTVIEGPLGDGIHCIVVLNGAVVERGFLIAIESQFDTGQEDLDNPDGLGVP